MQIKKLSSSMSVSAQVLAEDVAAIKAAGFRSIICNRPDGEGADQPNHDEIAAAAKADGIELAYLPIVAGKVGDDDADAFATLMADLPGPVLAYCRTGTRSATLWSLAQAKVMSLADILASTKGAGYDMAGVVRRIANGGKTPTDTGDARYEVVIVGAGAAGVSVAASLKARKPGMEIAIIDPSDVHYYQPGWTMVGGGIFDAQSTAKTMGSLIPKGVHWLKSAVAAFEPENNAIILDGCRVVKYGRLIVCPGIKLDWNRVEGLVDTLGKNGVTSNYRYDLAPYTWELVQNMKEGRAIFTQPPMPIKCAGAPQKAMYLSCSLWEKAGVLGNIDLQFHNAVPSLFGVKEYVPPLMEYVKRYDAHLRFGSKLVAVDGPNHKATFAQTDADGKVTETVLDFDMLHVTPPQRAVAAVAQSPLADATGFVEVNAKTLQHTRFANIFGIGDGCNTPNSKTAAAARKQAPIVAVNLLSVMDGNAATHAYDGYGSCPLTVEHGRAIVAEFGYGGKLLPSFPWDSTKPRWLGWVLKANFLPWLYWNAMLKGREWLAAPLERHQD